MENVSDVTTQCQTVQSVLNQMFVQHATTHISRRKQTRVHHVNQKQIVLIVQRRRTNAQHVPKDGIQPEQVVHCVQNNIVKNVELVMVNAHHVKLDIILMETNAQNVQTQWPIVHCDQTV